MRQKLDEPLHEALPANRTERRLFTSQMLGFVILPVVGMALLGVVILFLETLQP